MAAGPKVLDGSWADRLKCRRIFERRRSMNNILPGSLKASSCVSLNSSSFAFSSAVCFFAYGLFYAYYYYTLNSEELQALV